MWLSPWKSHLLAKDRAPSPYTERAREDPWEGGAVVGPLLLFAAKGDGALPSCVNLPFPRP